MASPLLLRPYFDGSTQYHPLALLLPGWKDCVSVPVRFDTQPQDCAWPKDPDERRSRASQVPPMKERGDDALSAFMAYFKE